MSKLICDVCGKEAIGVAASVTGPVSYAYCKECLKEGRESYGSLVSMVSCCGNDLNSIGEPYRKLVIKNLEYYNKTIEEFNADVKKSNDEMIAYFDSIKDVDFEEARPILIEELEENEF